MTLNSLVSPLWMPLKTFRAFLAYRWYEADIFANLHVLYLDGTELQNSVNLLEKSNLQTPGSTLELFQKLFLSWW